MPLELYPTAFRCLLLGPIVTHAEPGEYAEGATVTVEEADPETSKPTGRRCYTVLRKMRQSDSGGLWLVLDRGTRRAPKKRPPPAKPPRTRATGRWADMTAAERADVLAKLKGGGA